MFQCMLAGGLGGTSGDMLMHSIDTVKTRQQGDPHSPPKYGSLPSAYFKILRQEGFARGLYSGVTPAFLGSFPGTIIFFGTYEYSKRSMVDSGINHTLAYLASGVYILHRMRHLGLLMSFRLYCRLCSIIRIRPIGGSQNTLTVARSIQQPFF